MAGLAVEGVAMEASPRRLGRVPLLVELATENSHRPLVVLRYREERFDELTLGRIGERCLAAVERVVAALD
jgi:hypothetical protein